MAPQMSPSSSIKQATRLHSSPGRRKGILHSRRWSSSGLERRARDVNNEGKRDPVNKALLIGIQYEGNDEHGNLMAAHEDVEKVKKMLIELYGFEEQNIAVLLDNDVNKEHGRPTYKNILKAMEDLIRGVQAGDTLYFHYSGHGEQVPCKPEDTSEDDGKDEAIVPCDATEDPDTWILDNILNDKLVKQLPVGAYLFAVFDMCHSGTALDLNNYDYPCNGLLKKCTRKITAGVRKMSSVFTRTTYRTASEVQHSAETSRKPSLKSLADRCVVITSERLSLNKVKSHKLSVDVQQAAPASSHAVGDISTPIRRCTLSKSEKAYVLQYQADTSAGIDYALVGAGGVYDGRSSDDRRHSSHTLAPHLSAILESTTEVDSHSAFRHMPHPTSPPLDSAFVKRAPSPFSFVWLLARKLVSRIRRLKRISRKTNRKETKGEWNVFSSHGLHRRKETIRRPLSRTPTGEENIPEKQATSSTVLQSGIVFESPPCSPSTPRGFDFFPRRASHPSIPDLQTGQVVSIAAANDAQLAMEYMDKDKGMKSLTATLVDILYTNPHPTIGNLMNDLSSWLQKSSKEMHKYFEDRRARYEAKARNPNLPGPRPPRNTQEKEWVQQEDEMQEMVLRTRPVQQPVVGTQLKINIDKENILPFLLPGA